MKAKKFDSGSVADDLQHFEAVIGSARNGNNPLTHEFNMLFELFRCSTEQLLLSQQQIERLKRQLVEMTRSLDLASRIDTMTRLANRRDILEKIEQEHSRAQRHQRTYSLIMVDIDDFRMVNDSYGINTGDDVIVEVACVLRDCVRSEDICSRWGGEEFLFLLPETPVEGAISVANKIIQSIRLTEFKAFKPGIRLTVSLGVGGFKPGLNFAQCLKTVEDALQDAKRHGKDRYSIAAG